MIELVNKSQCSGCSACFNACKFDALTMVADETGFIFPKIDQYKCMTCAACVRACPALEKPEFQSVDAKAYVLQHKDYEIRKQSTSGGAFTGIAQQIIKQGGVVFGASIDKNFNVNHTWVDNEAGLYKFRNSKYVQSSIGLAYREAEKILKTGRTVCFSGTPCQIYGLKKYLGKEYANLLTVDVMCRAVPSPKILHKYLEYQKEKFPTFDKVFFRDKGRGYSYSGVALYDGNKVLYRGSSESDPWLRLFLGGMCIRESCTQCLFQKGTHASDITLCDWWDVGEIDKSLDDNKGTTGLVLWTEKAKGLLKTIRPVFRIKEIELEKLKDRIEKREAKRKDLGKDFYIDADKLSPSQFINKYAPVSGNVRIKRYVRLIIYKLHIHNTIRNVIHYLRKIK